MAPIGILIRIGAAASLLLGLSACGTVLNFAIGVPGPWPSLSGTTEIYGGVQVDAAAVSKGWEGSEAWWSNLLSLLFVFDFPLSAALDTLTLPITIPIVLSREEPQPKQGGRVPVFP